MSVGVEHGRIKWKTAKEDSVFDHFLEECIFSVDEVSLQVQDLFSTLFRRN